MIQLLRWFFRVRVNGPVNGTIEETVAQHRQALNTMDHRLTDVEGRLRSGDARLKALEYREDVISRKSDSATG